MNQGWVDLEICTIKMGVDGRIQLIWRFVNEVFNSIAYIPC
jgi:hypothetical protein